MHIRNQHNLPQNVWVTLNFINFTQKKGKITSRSIRSIQSIGIAQISDNFMRVYNYNIITALVMRRHTLECERILLSKSLATGEVERRKRKGDFQ